MLTKEELSEIAKTNLEQMPYKEFCRLGRTDMYISGFKDGYNKGVKTKINTTTISDNPIHDYQKLVIINDYAKTIIQDLEKENEGLKETIRKGTSCGDWNDDVHACQMYLRHEELEEYAYQLIKAKEIIQKLCDWVSGRSGEDLELLEQAEKFVKEE